MLYEKNIIRICLVLVDRVQEAEKEVSHMLLKSIGKRCYVIEENTM